MSTIFFQSSMPRAGSTLLQNVLAQNPDIFATPTSGVLELVFSARQMYTESLEFKAQDTETMNKGFIHYCREGVHGWYDAVTDKPYVVDKSRGWGVHYDFLESFLGYQPKILCMVRDLRQIISSMEKKFRENPLTQDAIVNHANMSGTSRETVSIVLKLFEDRLMITKVGHTVVIPDYAFFKRLFDKTV